jgi:hypothetical protein
MVEVAVPGAIAFYERSHPTNVYIAFPRVSEQIEVFDPVAGSARSLVARGLITAIP